MKKYFEANSMKRHQILKLVVWSNI